jgi:hypothetical protein
VSTSALICLGQPRTLSIVPSFGEWRADASHERLGARKRVVARDPVALPTATSYCLRSATRRSDKDVGRETLWTELTLH